MSRIQTVTPSNSTVIDRWTLVATYWSDVLAKTGLEASRSGAHQCLCWRQRIEYGRATSITDLAAREGVTDAYVCRLLPLTCLAPDITTAYGTGKTLHLTERISRTAEDTLLYQYTVTDPVTFERPFTVEVPMRRGIALFEYACHEGNYAMIDILAGARAEEQAARSSGSTR